MPKPGIIKSILAKHDRDKSLLIEIVRDVQAALGWVSPAAIAEIAGALDVSKVDVEGAAKAYVLSIRGYHWDLGAGLSPQAEENLNLALDLVQKFLDTI